MSFDLIIVLCTRYHNIISDDIRFYKNVNALIMDYVCENVRWLIF